MEKLKQYKYIILIVLIFFGIDFYWYQIRPARIMHSCSWVKETLASIPMDPGITKEQAASNLASYNKCRASYPQKPIESSSKSGGLNSLLDSVILPDQCDALNVKYKAPTPAQPERIIYNPASKTQYDFCLHDKGLK